MENKPTGVEKHYAPNELMRKGPLPGFKLGELLVWKNWFWTVTEANDKGQVLITLKEPTINHALKNKLEGQRQTKHLKKMRRRERIRQGILSQVKTKVKR